MLRASLAFRLSADKLAGGLSSAPKRTRTSAQAPRTSDAKMSKLKNIEAALQQDRQAYEDEKPFSLIESLKTFPWKFFVSFMMLWTYAGWHLIPSVKGVNPDGSATPASEEAVTRRKLEALMSERRLLHARRKELAAKKAELGQSGSSSSAP
uniref:Uncharacterized protein n=1 Tax=Neobodo designis TaxID=312471 RepID=A0A6U4WMK3_NEODS